MTPQEFEYIQRAVAALDNPETQLIEQRKILRTMSQICDRAAREVELRLVDQEINTVG